LGNGFIRSNKCIILSLLAGKAFLDEKKGWQVLTANLKAVSGIHDVYFVFVNEAKRFNGMALQWVQFNNHIRKLKGEK